MALTDSGRLIPLQSQSVCRVDRPKDALTFTVSTASSSPRPLPSYIGVEALRVFTQDPTYAKVAVGRNSRWWRGDSELPALASTVVASSVDDFVALHRSASAVSPPALVPWHASVERSAPSFLVAVVTTTLMVRFGKQKAGGIVPDVVVAQVLFAVFTGVLWLLDVPHAQSLWWCPRV